MKHLFIGLFFFMGDWKQHGSTAFAGGKVPIDCYY